MRFKHSALIKTSLFKLFLLIALVSFIFLTGSCNQKKKMYKIGILSGLKFFDGCIEPFKDKMTELGYIEGDNVVYELRSSDFNMAAYEKFAEEFVENNVDLIFSYPTEVTLAAKTIAKDDNIPVVFNLAFIEDTGLIDSIKQPGDNITGVRYPGPDTAVKKFDILLQIFPDVKTIWIPYIKDYPTVKSQINALMLAAESAKITIIEAPVENPAELKENFDRYKKSIDAIFNLAEPLAYTHQFVDIYINYADNNKIPTVGSSFMFNNYNTIFGIDVDVTHGGEQAALICNKILDGANPGNIPVVSANSYFELNYKKAVEQGYKIPDGVIRQADYILR